MLKTRIITALWLAPLAFALVFLLPARGFSFALAGLLLVGAWEFRRLAGLGQSPAGWALLLVQAGIFTWLQIEHAAWMTSAGPVLGFFCGAWLLMFLRMPGYRGEARPDTLYRVLSFVCALIALSGAWVALTWLRQQEQGSWWILSLLLIIWAADISAYFTGRAFGKRKLAPHLSPGKTVAGLAGGLMAAAIVGWLAVTSLPTNASGGAKWIAISALVALVSVGGDLFISLHKRTSGFKDSGHIFPGHGGVLDRLDSLLAGAPFFAAGLLWLAGA